MKKFTATVNQDYTFSDLSEENLDMVKNPDGSFHLLHHHKAYRVEVLELDQQQKVLVLQLNGQRYRVVLEDHYDRLVKELGLEANVQLQIKEIKAPMPGLVLQLLVTPEQELAQGASLLILEAMKMENVLKMPGAGKIASIHVQQGEAVEKGQLLVVLE